MTDLLFLGVAAVSAAFAARSWQSWRRQRHRRARRALAVVQTAFGCAFTLLAPSVQTWQSAVVPSLGRLMSNACTLVAAFGFVTLVRHVNLPPARAAAGAPRRLGALAGALLLMAVLFAASDVPAGLGIFSGLYRDQSTLAGYTLTYSGYLGYALAGLAAVVAATVRAGRGALRAGMLVVLAGSVVGFGYLGHKVLSVAREILDPRYVAEPLCAAPLANLHCTLSIVAPAVAVLLILAGAAVPAAAAAWRTVRRWPGEWRAYRRLAPLWAALAAAVPEVAWSAAGAGGPRRLDVTYLLYRRVIEINDGLLLLRPYRDDEADGPDEEAAVIRRALHRRAAAVPVASAAPVSTGSPGSTPPAASARLPGLTPLPASSVPAVSAGSSASAVPAESVGSSASAGSSASSAPDFAAETRRLAAVADAYARLVSRGGSGPARSTGR